MTDPLAQAVAAHRVGDVTTAESLYRAALRMNPARADARFNLGMICGQAGRMTDARQEFAAAVAAKPDFFDAWLMLAECADHCGDYAQSLTASEQATRLNPAAPKAWLRYGLALNRFERDEEAATAYRRAADLDPRFIAAWVNLCISLKNIGQPNEALATIRRAMALAGQNTSTDDAAEESYGLLHWHLALLELALDDYHNGFAHFRARFKGGTNWRRTNAIPLWRGEDLCGKTILITAEQGHGDTLMMARYLPLLKQRGARVVFQPHPALTRLFAGWDGVDDVVAWGAEPPPCNVTAPVFDLPYRFGTEIPTLPPPCGEGWGGEGDGKSGVHIQEHQRSCGVVWAGQPDNVRDHLRSLPLDVFADIFSAPNYAFYNLTRDLKDGDTETMARHGVTNLAPQIVDFADAAQIVAQLDLVITCDTAMAHLAGSMGKPVWILLPFVPDWRWGYGRDTSPWYPSARLFRQTRRGDWVEVIQRVREAITAL